MGSAGRRRCRAVVVGGLLLTGTGLGIAPAHAAVDGRCTVAATPSVTYRIASPTVVREGPTDACVRVVDAKVVDVAALRPLLAAKALVAVPRPTPRPAPVVPPATAPPATAPSTRAPSTTAPEPPASTAPTSPSTPATPSTAAGSTSPPPGSTLPAGGSALPGAPAVPPTTTSPAGTTPAGTPGALPGQRPVPVSGPAAAPGSPAATSPGGTTLLSPRSTPVTGSSLGVDLLAPVGAAPVLEGDPDAPLVAPQQAEAPETVLLRNLGESDPTGVHSTTSAEALAARHRPGLLSAAVGAAILAGLAGFAVRHRVLSRYRRRPSVASGHRLVEVSVRSRPDA